MERPSRWILRLFEDGVELGPGNSTHDAILSKGGGRYSHWGRQLWFSTPDGSDPGSNGRSYTVLVDLGAEGNTRKSMLLQALAAEPDALGSAESYAWAERIFATFVPDARVSEEARSYFKDTVFQADYERFDRTNYRSYDRKFAMRELLKIVMHRPGHVAECGVFKGASAYLLAKGLAASPVPGAGRKRLRLFDSFAGLSEPDARDGSHWRAGALAGSLAEVTSNLAPFADRITFHPGWIPERFGDVAADTFCFVHIDVDLYEPTSQALAFFGPRMVRGGVILCDDYGFETCPGAREAMDRYADQVGLPILHLPTGQGAIFSESA